MKAGFKPKLFTKKEWEDNRSPTAKGSGVGKAVKAVPMPMREMLTDSRHYKANSPTFCFYETFLAVANSQFPIANFSM